MCVLARTLDNPQLLNVYVKGAPEKIRDLCRPETGTEILLCNECRASYLHINLKVPTNFKEVLRSLTQNGLRVLAVAHRSMDLQWDKSENIQRLVEVEFIMIFFLKISDGKS